MQAGDTRSRPPRWARSVLTAVLGILVLPAAASAASISGTAFEDFNDNGVRNNGNPQLDAGVGGITVKAYRADGAEVASTTTAANGTYSLDVPDGIGEVRVEFTDLPPGYQPARHGAASGTTVQFVNGSASGVDVGVLQPFNFCQDNPQLAVACMRFGGHAAENANDVSIRVVPDGTADQTSPVDPASDPDPALPGEVAGALFSQTGTVFGVAQPTGSRFLYSSAFTKRHADWGPGGAGAIYRTDIDVANGGTPNASVFFDVNSLPGNPAGSVQRGADAAGNGTTNWVTDRFAWDAVGTTGLGNLATNDAGDVLYTVGLATGQLIRVPIPADGSSPAAGDVGAYDIPSPCTPADDARPMAVEFKDGLVYVGGVCSMASVGDPPGANNIGDARMRVYVYTFDPQTGTFGAAPVLDDPLQADRNCVGRDGLHPFPNDVCTDAAGNPNKADWHPWTSQSTQGTLSTAGFYPQPMLVDIEFVGDDLALGIRDRSADQLGNAALFPDGTGSATGFQSGYTLRACDSGGALALESNGVCGGVTTSGPQNATGWGPGGGRFYWEQQWNTLTPTGAPGPGGHDYSGQGGSLQIPGYPELRTAGGYGVDQCPPGLNVAGCPGNHGPHSSAGVLYLNNADGSRAKGFNLYTGNANPDGTLDTFAKANGLGDLEALCEAAPIEIGNYVWLDPDRDGIQDAGEKKLEGVTVELLDAGGSVIATTTTNANGQYFFNEGNVPSAVQPNTAYTVRIPLDQPALAPYLPTSPDTSAQLRDSDGLTEGRFVVDRLTTGAAGHNDHTHDFGFVVQTWDQRIAKTSSAQRVRLGEEVTYTLTVENVGPDASRPGGVVRDAVPEQFDVVDVTAGAGATCGRDDNDVRCELGAMAAGQKIEVKVRARAIRPGGTVNVAFLEECCNRPREETPPVPVTVIKPTLGLTKGANKKTVRAGGKVTFTLRTRNPSDGTLRNVRTCDNLPSGLVYVRSKPKAKLTKGRYCWTAKRLRPGQTRTYKLVARAVAGAVGKRVTNRAAATSPDARTRRAKRAVRVNAGAVRGGGVTG